MLMIFLHNTLPSKASILLEPYWFLHMISVIKNDGISDLHKLRLVTLKKRFKIFHSQFCKLLYPALYAQDEEVFCTKGRRVLHRLVFFRC